ncbi:ABC transporter substrate-binding protein [Paraglaciecola sp. 2405UD69-4]|uniref:ABC transporter substrate-binding protein n=1 Tax=Paraglaciecola sp. 2405UD69-4 TaxID=3391836 RepID=UPI0039C9D5CF
MLSDFIKALSAICFAAMALSNTAIAQSSHDRLPQSIKDKGEIIIGINAIYPPMEYVDLGTGVLTGFDVELAQALGTELKIDIKFENQKFDQLINSVNTSRVDMVMSGLSDNAKRRETLDFIDYFNTGTQVFTTRRFSTQIRKIADISGKLLAVSGATDYLTTVQKWSADNLEAKGMPAINIMAVDSAPTARLQMIQGRAQASAVSPEVLGWVIKQAPGTFVPVGPVLDPAPYGIAFTKTNTQLRDAVFFAMQALFNNGTYQALLAKWEITAGTLSTPLINGKKPVLH